MITEDYVPFDIAKLLKEKGFDEPCHSYYMATKLFDVSFHRRVYVEEEPFFNSHKLKNMYDEKDKTLFEDRCAAPTLQMACKWLREEKGLIIEIDYESYGDKNNGKYRWFIKKKDYHKHYLNISNFI